MNQKEIRLRGFVVRCALQQFDRLPADEQARLLEAIPYVLTEEHKEIESAQEVLFLFRRATAERAKLLVSLGQSEEHCRPARGVNASFSLSAAFPSDDEPTPEEAGQP